jgi:cytochrome c-type biogenesis protein CcmH/NrfF
MKNAISILLLIAGAAYPAQPDAGLNAREKERYHHLCQGFIAPCCWSQPVEVHDSPAAVRARSEVVALIRAGKTDREIKDAFIQEYGERILAEPEGMKSVVLTTVPIAALCLSLFLLWRFLSRQRKRLSLTPPQYAHELFPDTDWD